MDGLDVAVSVGTNNSTVEELRRNLLYLDPFSVGFRKTMRKQKVALLLDGTDQILAYGPNAFVEYERLIEEETNKRFCIYAEWKDKLLSRKNTKVEATVHYGSKYAPKKCAYELTALLYKKVVENVYKTVKELSEFKTVVSNSLDVKDAVKIFAFPKEMPVKLRRVFFNHDLIYSMDDQRLCFVYEPHAVIFDVVAELHHCLKSGASIVILNGGSSTFGCFCVKVVSLEPLKLQIVDEDQGLAFGMSRIDYKFKEMSLALNKNNENDDTRLWFLKLMDEFVKYKERSLQELLVENNRSFVIKLSAFEPRNMSQLLQRARKLLTKDEGCTLVKRRKDTCLQFTTKYMYKRFFENTYQKVFSKIDEFMSSNKFDFVLYAGAAYNSFDLVEKTRQLTMKHIKYVSLSFCHILLICIIKTIMHVPHKNTVRSMKFTERVMLGRLAS